MLQVDYLPSVLFAYLELFRFIFLVCKHTHTHLYLAMVYFVCACPFHRAQVFGLLLALLYFTVRRHLASELARIQDETEDQDQDQSALL